MNEAMFQHHADGVKKEPNELLPVAALSYLNATNVTQVYCTDDALLPCERPQPCGTLAYERTHYEHPAMGRTIRNNIYKILIATLTVAVCLYFLFKVLLGPHARGPDMAALAKMNLTDVPLEAVDQKMRSLV